MEAYKLMWKAYMILVMMILNDNIKDYFVCQNMM